MQRFTSIGRTVLYAFCLLAQIQAGDVGSGGDVEMNRITPNKRLQSHPSRQEAGSTAEHLPLNRLPSDQEAGSEQKREDEDEKPIGGVTRIWGLFLGLCLGISAITTNVYVCLKKKATEKSGISDKKRPIRFREIYSATATVVLEILYGVCVLSLLAMPSEDIARYGLARSQFFYTCAGVLYLGSFTSHIAFHWLQPTFKLGFVLSANFFGIGLALPLLQALTGPSLWLIYLARFIVGLGAGITAGYLPLYLGAIATESVKSYFELLPIAGYLLGILGYNIFSWKPLISYQSTIKALVVGAFVLGIFMQWIMSFNKPAQGQGSLRSLFGKWKVSWPSIALIAVLFTNCAICGVNQIVANPEAFFKQNYEPFVIVSLLAGAAMIPAASFAKDKVGLKPGVLIGSALVMISLVSFYYDWAGPIFGILFCVGYNMGIISTPYFVVHEIFPPEYIPAGMFLGLMITRLMTALSLFTPHKSIGTRGDFFFLIYAVVVGVSAGIFCLMFKKRRKGEPPVFLE